MFLKSGYNILRFDSEQICLQLTRIGSGGHDPFSGQTDSEMVYTLYLKLELCTISTLYWFTVYQRLPVTPTQKWFQGNWIQVNSDPEVCKVLKVVSFFPPPSPPPSPSLSFAPFLLQETQHYGSIKGFMPQASSRRCIQLQDLQTDEWKKVR